MAVVKKSKSGVQKFALLTNRANCDTIKLISRHPVIFSILPPLAVFIFAFSLGFFSFRFGSPILSANATIDPSYYQVSLSAAAIDDATNSSIDGSGNLDFRIEATTDGTTIVKHHRVTVSTNAHRGYKLYLSASTNGRTLGHESAPDTIAPAPGTHSAPAPLPLNSWGYAIPAMSFTQFTVGVNNFSNNYWPDGIMSGKVQDSKWAGLPSASSPVLIQHVPNNDQPSRELDLYYAVHANSGLSTGRYRGGIIYTAIIDATNISNSNADGELTLSPVTTKKLSGGEKLTVSTSLKSLLSSGQSLRALLSAEDLGVTVGTKPCINVKILSPLPGIGNSASSSEASSTLSFECDAPALSVGHHDLGLSIARFPSKTYQLPRAIEYKSSINNFPDSLTYLQDMTPEICAAVTTPKPEHLTPDFLPEKDLIDRRDNKVYKIRKLADGNCWMVDNLALILDKDKALTPADTDIRQPWTPSSSTNPTNQFVPWGDTEYAYTHANSYDATGHDPRYGVVYNWHAATAGGNANNYKTHAMHRSHHNESICPHGWRLPINYYGDRSFYNLFRAYGDYRMYQALRLVRHGIYYHHYIGGHYRYDSVSAFWTATFYSTDRFGYLVFTHNSYSFGSGSYVGDGHAVRCIARGDHRTLSDLTYMQDMVPEICDNTALGVEKSLIDRRDGKAYRVFKAKDGSCWMGQNLALKLSPSKTLTSADTDISVNWIPEFATQSPSDQGANFSWPADFSTARSYDTGTNAGVLYNYRAVLANNNIEAYHPTLVSNNIPESICPRGWQLPSGQPHSRIKGFADFNVAQSVHYSWNFPDNILLSAPANYLRSGKYDPISGAYLNSNNGFDVGLYYSSTPASPATPAATIYALQLDGQTKRVSIPASTGAAVRCLSRWGEWKAY